MSRTLSLLLVIAVWAAGYLPALGSLQIRGEEGRRILPAVAMVDGAAAATDANGIVRAFVVPQVAGRDYLRKPPLVNWLIAASFSATGVRSAWTARLPSVLFVLAAAIAFLTIARRRLGAAGSTVAALCWLTSLGTLEKGRMIEIDAINTSLCAVALVCWLTWWLEGHSPWKTWAFPSLLLGLSLLAKGPVVLSFFYALIAAVLWRARRLDQLVSRYHVLGLLLMLAIFCVWAVPLLLQLGTQAPLQVWSREMALPVAGRDVLDLGHWILNVPRGATLFLPAALLLPFIRYDRIEDALERECARTLARAALALFLIVLLLPGSYPKYAMPLLPAMCWLIGVAVANNAFEWRLGFKDKQLRVPRPVLVGGVALLAAAAVIGVPLHAATFPEAQQHVKRNAARIDAAVPAGEPLYVLDAPHESFLFYLRPRLRYVESVDELPADARYFMARRARYHEAIVASARWPTPPRIVAETDASPRNVMAVYAVDSP